jgi:hypothetical protein
MYGNAVNVCGVWAATAMPADELRGMARSFPDTVTQTEYFESADEARVREWAEGARAACAEFRSEMARYCRDHRAQESHDNNSDRQRGRAAFLASLSFLMK